MLFEKKGLIFRAAVLTAFLTVFYCAQLNAQTSRSMGRTAYVEMFGNGLLYSFNYDQRFEKRMDGLGFRTGASYISIGDVRLATFPLGLNYLLGKNGKYFEMGLGMTLAYSENRKNFFAIDDISKGTNTYGTMNFGYRYEPEEGGFTFRAGISPVFDRNNFFPFFPSVSFGYAF